MFDCTINTGAQIPEDVEQHFFFVLSFLSCLGQEQKKLSMADPFLPFPSIPFPFS
jgi:hypothetical protein